MQNLHYLATATLKMKSMDFRFSFFSAALAGKSPRVSAHRTNCTSHVFETPLQSVKTKRALSLGSTTTFTTIRQRRIETREETRHETSVPSSRTEKRTLARAPFLPTRRFRRRVRRWRQVAIYRREKTYQCHREPKQRRRLFLVAAPKRD